MTEIDQAESLNMHFVQWHQANPAATMREAYFAGAPKWQPIETAPRGIKGYAWMYLAWGPAEDQTCSAGMRCGDKFFSAGTFYYGGKERIYQFREAEVTPTHWMPLPPAPGAAPTPPITPPATPEPIHAATVIDGEFEWSDDIVGLPSGTKLYYLPTQGKEADQYCPKCNGEGVIHTGISEASTTSCRDCSGTGVKVKS